MGEEHLRLLTTEEAMSRDAEQLHSMRHSESPPKKANKPLMEKRRRARINKSLMELKAFLVRSSQQSTPGQAKWEKADILEMTVAHLRSLDAGKPAGEARLGPFVAGFAEAIRQCRAFVEGWDAAEAEALLAKLLTALEALAKEAGARDSGLQAEEEAKPAAIPLSSPSSVLHSPRVTSTSAEVGLGPPAKRPRLDLPRPLLHLPQGPPHSLPTHLPHTLHPQLAAALYSRLISGVAPGDPLWRPW